MKKEQTKIRQIQEWLLQGQLITDILRNIMDKWVLPEEEAIEFIAAAFEDFTKKVNKGYTETRAYHIQLRLNLYKELYQKAGFINSIEENC